VEQEKRFKAWLYRFEIRNAKKNTAARQNTRNDTHLINTHNQKYLAGAFKNSAARALG
jgi:hypothetical protein